MAVHIRLLDYTPATGGILWPAPSVRDHEHFQIALEMDTTPPLVHPEDMHMRVFKVLCDYRGALLYVEGGVQVFRYAPRSEWYNGSTCFPVPGTIEDCRMYVGGTEYMSRIEFV